MAIGILVSTILSVLAFFGLAFGIQLRILKTQIEARLRILEGYARGASEAAKKALREVKAENIDTLVETVNNFFVIEPVSIEPIDIIKRMDKLLRTANERLEWLVDKAVPNETPIERKQIIVTLLGISNALTTIYKFVRHILLTGLKTKNATLIAQLWMILPMIMRTAKAFYDAIPGISQGKPIGDAAGPLVAYRLMKSLKEIEPPREIAKDTIYGIYEYKNRKVVIVKAKGPGSTVGRPGEAIEKLAKTYHNDLALLITVDAALKYEGEETGTIAEGIGAAIGDPGPEKIRIERTAVRYNIPLYAIVIRMSLEEALHTMRKEIAESIDKAVERVKKIIEDIVPEGKIVIVAGIGNTIGIAQ